MDLLAEFFKMALANIAANKARSFLTMLGIIIGIASVVAVMSVGAGFKKGMTGDLNSMFSGQIVLFVSDEAQAANDLITAADVEALSAVEGVRGVTPDETYTATVTTEKDTFNVNINAGNALLALNNSNSSEVRVGRYFNDSDVESGRRLCVITRGDALRLFGSDDVVGMTLPLSLSGMTLDVEICGLREKKEGSSVVSMDYGDTAVAMEMPYTALADWGFGSETGFSSVLLFVEEGADSSSVVARCGNLLKGRHNVVEDDYFKVENFTDYMGEVNKLLDTATAFIAFVAAISLLVGGIGVMNIMLVSVTERTREIGIRRALGAKTSSVLIQFLMESAIVAFIGGAVGIVLGSLVAAVICLVARFPLTVGVGAIVLATSVSCGIGLLFGVYPARKAARLSPIEALRRE